MKDWKTTSAGVLAIVSGIVAIVFSVVNKTFTSESLMSAITGILAGIGLLYTPDAKQ